MRNVTRMIKKKRENSAKCDKGDKEKERREK